MVKCGCGCWDCNPKKQTKHWQKCDISTQEMEFLDRGQVICFLLRLVVFPVKMQNKGEKPLRSHSVEEEVDIAELDKVL